jgi:hypothetical protein
VPHRVDVLDDDVKGSGQIDAMLADPWRGNQVSRLVEEMRLLLPKLEMVLAIARQSATIKQRRQDPETVFFLTVRDLFGAMMGDPEPGLPGPCIGSRSSVRRSGRRSYCRSQDRELVSQTLDRRASSQEGKTQGFCQNHFSRKIALQRLHYCSAGFIDHAPASPCNFGLSPQPSTRLRSGGRREPLDMSSGC